MYIHVHAHARVLFDIMHYNYVHTAVYYIAIVVVFFFLLQSACSVFLFYFVYVYHRVHVVFGRVVQGADYVTTVENQKVDVNHRPYADVRIHNCGELVLMKRQYCLLSYMYMSVMFTHFMISKYVSTYMYVHVLGFKIHFFLYCSFTKSSIFSAPVLCPLIVTVTQIGISRPP